MGVGTNASWLGVPPDDDIYVVGSMSYDTYGNLAITKSSDGGNSWSQPLTFARSGSCPEIVSDGESLYVVYTSPQPFEGALYIKKSSDWGQTWSEEKLLVAPQTTTKSIRAFSMQYIDSSRAFLTIREQAIGDQILATGIGGRDRVSGDQRFGQAQHIAHDLIPNFCLKPLSVKPTLTAPSSATSTGRLTRAGYSLISKVHSGSEPGVLRDSGSVRQVADARLINLCQPPSWAVQDFKVSGAIRCAR